MPTKNSNDAIGNRTRDLPACSTVRTVPLCTPENIMQLKNWISFQ